MATRALVTTKIARNWSVGQWQSAIKHAVPSGDGKVGVIFCWCANPSWDGPNFSKVATADFVIKPSAGAASTTKFAEKFMKDVIGTRSVNTYVIAKTDPRFTAILTALERYRHAASASVSESNRLARNHQVLLQQARFWRLSEPVPPAPKYQVSQKIADAADRWSGVWSHYQNADALMVQDMATAMVEFKEEFIRDEPNHNLTRMLQDAVLMRNLGKLFAADAVLGNGDRLCMFNPGNILYDKFTGEVWSIDSQTVLVNYQAMLQKASDTGTSFTNNVDEYVGQLMVPNRGEAISVPGEIPAPSFGMERFFNIDSWWTVMWRGGLESSLLKRNIPSPPEDVWLQARLSFQSGLDEGLKAVDSALSGLSWLKVKRSFQSYQKKYGSSPDMDWTNFKLRRLYVQAVLAEYKRYGGAMNSAQRATAQERALCTVKVYANRKLVNTV